MTRRETMRAGGHPRHVTLTVPKRPRGLVVIARGTAGGIHGPSLAETVASVLERGSVATARLDLVTPAESREAARDGESCLELQALADRLDAATHALLHHAATRHLSIGYFGEGIGAPVSLVSAARHAWTVHAIVACGTVTALGAEDLGRIAAATLLVADGEEPLALELAAETLRHLRGERSCEVVPGATLRSGDPDVQARVADLAAGWFVAHLAPAEHVLSEDLGGWGP